MTHVPFRSARTKLKRASELTADIGRKIETYDGASLVPMNWKEGMVVWVVRVRENPSDDLAAMAGEVIHQLRSALDTAAVSVVHLNNGNTNNVYFPFAESAELLDKQIKDKNFSRASDEAIALLRSLRPYRGGDAALRALHDLDVVDKHKDLIALGTQAHHAGHMSLGGYSFAQTTFGMQDGQQAIATPGIAAILRHYPLSVLANFNSAPFKGQKLIPTLNAFSQLANRTVEAFAALYRA